MIQPGQSPLAPSEHVEEPPVEASQSAALQTDVTKNGELETRLRHAQKMEVAGTLAAGIAHDLNNVLCVIQACAAHALGKLSPEDGLCEDIQEIGRAGERATALTRQLLALSGEQPFERRKVDPSELLLGMETMLRRILGDRIGLSLILIPAMGGVYVDPNQMEQVIMNLAVNARDAMPDGGKLTIETCNGHADAAYAGTHPERTAALHMMLKVSDTETGMDSATVSRIFEPFFTTKKAGKGTGLGLSVALGIVKQNEGHIKVESSLGHGTSFSVYLPRTA